MKKLLIAALLGTSLLFSGCADAPNDSVKFGRDPVGKTARQDMKDHRGTKTKDACQKAVDALPKDELAKYNRDDVLKGCVQANTSDG